MAKQRLVKKGSQYGILDEASNTVLPISENMKLVQKQGRYGILDGNSVIPIDDFSESISDSDLDILKKKILRNPLVNQFQNLVYRHLRRFKGVVLWHLLQNKVVVK